MSDTELYCYYLCFPPCANFAQARLSLFKSGQKTVKNDVFTVSPQGGEHGKWKNEPTHVYNQYENSPKPSFLSKNRDPRNFGFTGCHHITLWVTSRSIIGYYFSESSYLHSARESHKCFSDFVSQNGYFRGWEEVHEEGVGVDAKLNSKCRFLISTKNWCFIFFLTFSAWFPKKLD